VTADNFVDFVNYFQGTHIEDMLRTIPGFSTRFWGTPLFDFAKKMG